MAIFISHATADKDIADAFVDLLQTGLDIPQKDIFCSSLEGLGIPHGTKFVDFIGGKLANAKFVIALLTPVYYERAFCLCELGATWILQPDFFPLLIPPLEFKDLKAVLEGTQSGSIVDKTTLNELRDRLIKAGWATGKTSRWEVKRDEFLEKMKGIKVHAATTVSADKLKAVEENYSEAQKVIGEKNQKITELEKLIEELKKCKDQKQVAAAIKEHKAGNKDEFKDLLGAFKEATKGVPSVVIEAMYYEHCGEDWCPKAIGNEELWEEIDNAKDRNFLSLDDGRVSTRSHPMIKKLERILEKIDGYLMGDTSESEFVENFEDEHNYSLDLTNKDFWSDYLCL